MKGKIIIELDLEDANETDFDYMATYFRRDVEYQAKEKDALKLNSFNIYYEIERS